ncbi:MAG: DUF3024 domain-containing protein [Bacteroidetes bacterium]|nr:DUF3024 domain-containing protein [Bacteroidota bacterium]
MPIDTLQVVEVIEVMENFLSRVRPPENIRPELDIGYRIDGQNIFIFEIRPKWKNPEIICEYEMAKTTFVKAKNHWKVFWMRSNLKWYSYTPKPTVKTVAEFVHLVEEDKHGCFWG